MARYPSLDYEDKIKENEERLDNKEEYENMSKASNPYGDGKSSIRIADAIEKYFSVDKRDFNW